MVGCNLSRNAQRLRLGRVRTDEHEGERTLLAEKHGVSIGTESVGLTLSIVTDGEGTD
jgi:hypothetical protein